MIKGISVNADISFIISNISEADHEEGSGRLYGGEVIHDGLARGITSTVF